jgi:acetyl-CoA carboxylase carboxyl transferase subunit alpha
MKLAEKYGLPVLVLADTPGARMTVEAEARGQMSAIAVTVRTMSRLRVPIVIVTIGEGGSHGELALMIGDHVAIMQYASMSVTTARTGLSGTESRWMEPLTGDDAVRLGLADEVIAEPLGGAHCNPAQACQSVKACVVRATAALCRYSPDDLLARRRARFRTMCTPVAGTGCAAEDVRPTFAACSTLGSYQESNLIVGTAGQ